MAGRGHPGAGIQTSRARSQTCGRSLRTDRLLTARDDQCNGPVDEQSRAARPSGPENDPGSRPQTGLLPAAASVRSLARIVARARTEPNRNCGTTARDPFSAGVSRSVFSARRRRLQPAARAVRCARRSRREGDRNLRSGSLALPQALCRAFLPQSPCDRAHHLPRWLDQALKVRSRTGCEGTVPAGRCWNPACGSGPPQSPACRPVPALTRMTIADPGTRGAGAAVSPTFLPGCAG